MKPSPFRLLVPAVLVLVCANVAPAQTQPPVRGTVALEGTMKKFYDAAQTVVVTTIDGVDHVYHVTKDLIVHGGKDEGAEALKSLREGTTVVVHYTVVGADASADEIDWVGDQGMQVTEGMVTDINRRKKEITIRYDNGKKETLRLTDRAAEEAGKGGEAVTDASKVVVYYSNEAGQKVAHFFKKVSG